MPSRTFAESGGFASQDFVAWAATSGTVAFDASKGLKLSTGSPATLAFATSPNGVLSDAGGRVSWWFEADTAPAADGTLINFLTSGGLVVFSVTIIAATGKLQLTPLGATAVNGNTVLAINTKYQLTVGFTITNTTTFRFDLYLNGVLEGSATAGTLTRTGTSSYRIRAAPGFGANANVYYRDMAIDDGNDYSYPGQVKVTAKRPFANGTANNFSTQIGAGGSSYGTGHAQQVNERPLNTANGWSMVGAGAAVTEEYTIEGRSVGDVDLAGKAIIDVIGCVYAKSLLSETGQIVVDGVASNISLTNANTLFTKITGSTTYPAGTGTDIGIVTDTTVTTVSLFEAWVNIVYKPGVPVLEQHYRRLRAA